MITEQDAGVELHNVERMDMSDWENNLIYREPAFDHTKVEQCFNKILKEPKYRQNMEKLQRMSKVKNGRQMVVDTVESIHNFGTEHLVDKDLKRMFHSKMRGNNHHITYSE